MPSLHYTVSELKVKPEGKRPSWVEYFMGVASLIAQRGSCYRASVGTVLVKDNHIISTGYNGSLPGTPTCLEMGCIIQNDHCIRTIHSEVNAVLQAGLLGNSLVGAEAYVTHLPCVYCLKVLLRAGVTRIYYCSHYTKKHKEEFFRILSGLGFMEPRGADRLEIGLAVIHVVMPVTKRRIR